MGTRSLIAGCGGYLPERIVTNEELSQRVDTYHEWIVDRTGIRERRVAAEGECTSDLAISAARRALDSAAMEPDEVDLIVLATTTADSTFPATAAKVQAGLGVNQGAAFDVQAVCAGFIYAMAVADNFLTAGQAKNAVVIGAETFSRILDWEDRNTCVLFGDGAGAVALRAVNSHDGHDGDGKPRGVLSTHLHSDGRHYDLLYVDGGPSSTQSVGHVRMSGREVFRHAVVNLSNVVEEALDANDMTSDDIDWLVPHQANRRIIDGIGNKLGLDPEKIVLTIDRHANTSAASIPLALSEAVADGRIQPGDIVLMEAIGGGLTWGSALVRW